ncbi:MAG TPA: carboxypeptidase-like regulatory domain-containing protein [Acidobacteriaceae bacterium]|nr:carboxypeptidase-like regulatory domain-containing protein [Acidobacteriaceae bacterium]
MFLRRLVVPLLIVSAVGVLHAQEDRGRINGLVMDPSGAVIPQATVSLKSEATGVVVTHKSDASGQYLFELLNPGLYTLDVDSAGFKHFEVQHVRVQVAQHVGMNAKLEPGGSSETVTVTESGGAQLDTDDAVLGYTVEARSAAELPILYGNAFELQYLAPGVNSTSLSIGNHTYEGGSESTTVNGSQSGRTEFTLDGAPDTRNGGAVTTAYIPSRDFVGEFKLITSPYDASLAHTSGGSLDTSLKSGGSQYHGDLSFFYQDPNVDAPQFSLNGGNPAPGVKFHRESAEVNGPIIRQKLFFFAGYEHQYNRAAASTTTQTVPTEAERKGDFSALLPLGTTTTSTYTCPSTGQKVTTAPYNTYQIYNPYTTVPNPDCPGTYIRQAYQGNIIKNIDPVAAKILNYYPLPTGSAVAQANGLNNFVSNVANIDRYWNVATREDYNISDRQKIFGHYVQSERVQPGKNAYFPGASGQTLTLKNKAAVLDYVNTLSNSLILDARYSITRFTTNTSLDAKTTATDLGVNANALAGANPAAAGFPQVKITGYATLGNSDPGYEADTIHDGQINVTKILGRHSLRFGAEWRLYEANKADLTQEHLSLSSGGTYTRGPVNTLSASVIGQALAEFEAGIAENTAMTLNAATANNTTYWSGYTQDDWKVNPKLTINAGLRYEFFGAVAERNGKSVTYFDPTVQSPIATQAIANYKSKASASELALLPASQFSVNGGLQFENPGQPLWTPQKLNFSPRVGFSYNPIRPLVVRGGFGIFYQHLGEYVQYGNPLGFTQTTSTVATLDNGQTFQATLANPFPNGLVKPSGNSYGLLQNIGQSISQFYVQHPKSPYSERYSLGFQYELPGSVILEADYVGSTGQHLRLTRDFNPLPDRYLSTDPVRTQAMTDLSTKLSASYANPFAGITVPGSSSLTGTTISGTQLLKPYPEFTGVTAGDESGFSSYNALQLSAQKRFSHGYNMSVSFTHSKTLDALSFLNPGDAKPWYGISNTDYPNVLSVAGIYELPFGHGKAFLASGPGWVENVIGGFQVEGTYRVQSGQPISFNNAGSVLAPGYTYSDIGGASAHNVKQWFNTNALQNILNHKDYANNYGLVSNLRTFPLRFGNVRQDYQNLLNVGAIKKFNVYSERVHMDVRAEALNALNHPVYSNPNSDPSSSSFGVITGFGNSSRVLQFAVEAHF